MPMSSEQGKPWIKAHVEALGAQFGPLHVVDVGPGVGTYAKLLRGPAVDRLTGIEVWQPYVQTYRLAEHYDELIIGDIREVAIPDCDVLVIGDVAEHMTAEQAVLVWSRAAEAARHAVYLSIPIVHYPQHEIEDNPHEVHVDEDWDHERVLAAFAGIGDYRTDTEVGVYERRTD